MRRYSREWPAASCGADPGRSGAGHSPPVPADISGSRHAALPSGAARGQPGSQWPPAAGRMVPAYRQQVTMADSCPLSVK